jgi:hypothetical protein
VKTAVKSRYKYKPIRITVLFFVVITIVLFVIGYGDYSYSLTVPAYNPDSVPADCICPRDRNLPIVVIKTHGTDINELPGSEILETGIGNFRVFETSKRHAVTIEIYEKGDYGYTCTCGASLPSYTDNAEISLRGQSTLTMDKHQFTLSFTNSDATDRDVSLLGMPEGDKWVLNGSYFDRSLVRNALALDTARKLMEWSPRYEFCELLISNDDTVNFERDYTGVYLLQERIDRSPHRVNIQKADPRYAEPSFIIARDKTKNGDYIYNSDWSAMNDEFFITVGGRLARRSSLVSIYPNIDVTEDYRNKIKSYIDTFEYSLNSKYFDDPETGYRAYIDLDSFIQNAAVNEAFFNVDGGEVSTYFYKNMSGKMHAGPIWDFDNTLGNSPLDTDDSPYGVFIVGTSWYNRMFQDPFFSNAFTLYWRDIRTDELATVTLNSEIDRLIDELGPAAARNTEKWYSEDADLSGQSWAMRNFPFSYETEIADMKTYMSERLDWLDRNINLVYRIQENSR